MRVQWFCEYCGHKNTDSFADIRIDLCKCSRCERLISDGASIGPFVMVKCAKCGNTEEVTEGAGAFVCSKCGEVCFMPSLSTSIGVGDDADEAAYRESLKNFGMFTQTELDAILRGEK